MLPSSALFTADSRPLSSSLGPTLGVIKFIAVVAYFLTLLGDWSPSFDFVTVPMLIKTLHITLVNATLHTCFYKNLLFFMFTQNIIWQKTIQNIFDSINPVQIALRQSK